ncbi:MAG: hypothetical protein ACLSB9_25475 [Hydrogeniiclostridium mannosilyticum]
MVQLLHQKSDTHWFRRSGYGLFCHYLDHSRIKDFDVARFVDNVVQTGAGHVFFTLGQNSGYFCAPNATYDRYMGYQAGERCAERDLPMELAGALMERGIRLLLYLPCGAPANDEKSRKAFDVDKPAGAFDWIASPTLRDRWAEIIEEWAQRYGDKVSGWWFDGWFENNGMTEDIAQAYAKAAKAGNPEAILAFNRNIEYGIRPSCAPRITAERFGYFAKFPLSHWFMEPSGTFFLSGLLLGKPDIRYQNAYLANYVKQCMVGGESSALTYHRLTGEFAPEQMCQLYYIRKAVREASAFTTQTVLPT